MAPGYPAAQRDHLEILGTTGSIVLDGDSLCLVRGAVVEKDEALDLDANYAASYLGALTHFLDRLDDGKAFETSAEDNLETLRIVEEAYKQGTAKPSA
jgi:predicted dehydrogenase